MLEITTPPTVHSRSSINNNASQNSAFGNNALYYNYAAKSNTAAGFQALFNNDFSRSGMGEKNSAFGSHALWSNDDGSATMRSAPLRLIVT